MAESDKSPTETLFYILEATNGLESWTLAGTQVGRDRDHAARLFYAEREKDGFVDYVAVSESAWKPKRRHSKLVPKVEQMDLPMPGAPQIVETAPPLAAVPE